MGYNDCVSQKKKLFCFGFFFLRSKSKHHLVTHHFKGLQEGGFIHLDHITSRPELSCQDDPDLDRQRRKTGIDVYGIQQEEKRSNQNECVLKYTNTAVVKTKGRCLRGEMDSEIIALTTVS